MSQQLWKALHVLQGAASKEFERQHSLHLGRFRCGEGCDSCCLTPFSISEIEAAAVNCALASLPAQLAAQLQRRAVEYLDQRLGLFSQYGYRQSHGELAPEPERLACPALIGGRCVIYEHRPTLCRSFGSALMHSYSDDRVFACQLNFSPGERIRDPELFAAQSALSIQNDALSQAYDCAGGKRYSEPITVAHALLQDFGAYLP